MYCKNCGNEIKEEDLSCENCGTKVESNISKNKSVLKKWKKVIIIVISIVIFVIVGNIINYLIKHNIKGKEYSISMENINSTNNNVELLEQIYEEYPELRGVEDCIWTNGKDYWILNNDGEKIYFDSLDSFENAIRTASKDNGNEIVDREYFLNKCLTEDFKKILRKKTLESQKQKENDNFIEDRIEVSSGQIIYTYLYIYQVGQMKPALDANIFLILPRKQILNDLDEINSNFDYYFVIKKVGGASESFLNFNGVLTDSEIQEKMPLVNSQISEEIEEIKNFKISNSKKRELASEYLNYLANIPYGYGIDYSSTIASKHVSDYSYEYIQILDTNRVLIVRSYTKYTSPANYKVSGYSEYMAAGGCLDIDKLPYMPQMFTIQELVQAGYISEDNNNCVIAPIRKVMNTDGYSKEDYEKMYQEQDEYIRKNFGL